MRKASRRLTAKEKREAVRAYMARIGQRGGKVTGPAKRRGDSAHYRRVALARWGSLPPDSPGTESQ